DLLGRVEALEHDGELGLFGWLFDHRRAAARTGSYGHGRSRRLDIVDLFQVVSQFDGLGDRQGNNFFAEVLDVGGPLLSVLFSHGSSYPFLELFCLKRSSCMRNS